MPSAVNCPAVGSAVDITADSRCEVTTGFRFKLPAGSRSPVIPAGLVAALIYLLPLLAIGALTWLGVEQWQSFYQPDPWLWQVVKFTLWQATLSTLLSLGLALPTARALARRARFRGRALLLRLCSLSLIVPVIVAVMGIVTVHGKNGWANQLLSLLFAADGGHYLYGLNGILLAHLFFNWPLATRVLLQTLEQIPQNQWRLASQLGFSSRHILRWIEWPQLRTRLPGLAALIFLLCFSSFAVVMALGGGPRATTIELAIYQALRFDFDLLRAAQFALLQLAFTLLLLVLSGRLEQPLPSTPVSTPETERPDTRSKLARWSDGVLISALALFTLTPLLAVISAGINRHWLALLRHDAFWQATANSLLLGLGSGLLACLLATLLLLGSRHLRIRYGVLATSSRPALLIELAGSLILGVPALVLGTGLFVLLRPLVDVMALAPVLVLGINALMALPYVMRLLQGPLWQTATLYDRLCAGLALSGWQRWRWIEWPRLRQPMGTAMAIATTISLGDLGVIALFGSSQFTTLPLLIYQRMGSYQMAAASATALWLLLLCFTLFWLLEKLTGRPASDKTHLQAVRKHD